MIRVKGAVSEEMAEVLSSKATALRNLKQVDEARVAALKSVEIHEQIDGRIQPHIFSLETLASILDDQGEFEEGLRRIEDAISLLTSQDNQSFLTRLLNQQGDFLIELERYEQAAVVRNKHMELSLRLDGPDDEKYADVCLRSAELYVKVKQISWAIDLAKRAHAIWIKIFGPSHWRTEYAQRLIVKYKKALIDPEVKKRLVSKADRMCSYYECGKVEKKMGICLHCNVYYLCKDHHIEKIAEHMAVCPKHPDALWVERKLDGKIVKCRRCRKEGKLMTCSVCGKAWYCGAKCQKEDWKRHKLFCGKKK